MTADVGKSKLVKPRRRDLIVCSTFQAGADAVLVTCDCLALLRQLPDACAQLVVTSPPYNLGKSYEDRLSIDDYIEAQRRVIAECARILRPSGSICWQVGVTRARSGSVLPLDLILHPLFDQLSFRLRNRIIWHFQHGLNCTKRFSGRYETILWYSKTDQFYFNLNPVRVPQKYPGKRAYKGSRKGEYSGNPKGKNPGDVWIIPNVKGNHIEKTAHPCQFPIAIPETLILALTRPKQLVVDPYIGSGTTAVAALKNSRRVAGADINSAFVRIARQRVRALGRGELRYRDRRRSVFQPQFNGVLTTPPPGFLNH